MDFTALIEVIKEVGFPIAACVYMAHVNKESAKQFAATVADITEDHKEEMKMMRDALNNNTSAINSLSVEMRREGVVNALRN